MKHFKVLLPLTLMAALLCAACSQPSSSGYSSSDGNGSTSFDTTYIGSKKPSKPKEVGDIVFNDGSAMAYTAFAALDDTAKNAKKAAAIALIFYKGTGLNSDDSEGNADTTTSRTLGVGLKHNRSGLAWCLNSANAYSKNITTIQCPASGSAGALTFTGDKNGSDNLAQIGTFLTGNSSTDDTATEANYPAFYFAKNYSSTASNLGETYKDGWHLPSIAELFQIYACRADTSNGFDIDAASEALGGDKFDTSRYWSSSQHASIAAYACILLFDGGNWTINAKLDNNYSVCCIRAFN